MITTDSTKVLVSKDTGESMDALASGAVRLVGGCLGIDDFVVIWPPGTTVTDERPLTIEVPGIGSLHEGSHLELGGGFIQEMPDSPANLEDSQLGLTVPDECANRSIWLAGPGQ